MILPRRAAVRPRVVSIETGEPILLEDLVGSHAECGKSVVIELAGEAGAGKTTALAHLATLSCADRLVLVDDLMAASLPEHGNGVLVYTTRRPLNLTDLHYQLASWSDDDLIEYLLSTHPDRCSSVMARVNNDSDRDRLDGSPDLFCVVAEQMAASESVLAVSAAVRRELSAALDNETSMRDAQIAATAVLLGQHDLAHRKTEVFFGRPGGLRLARLLYRRFVQVLLAADRLVGDLKQKTRSPFPKFPLPPDLIREVARLVRDDAPARRRLDQLAENKSDVPTIASILFQAETEWCPNRATFSYLRGGLFSCAEWQQINLQRADLSHADLSRSTLQNSNLSQALLDHARFSGANLTGTQLVRVRACEADFDRANLTGACLKQGVFQQSVFAGAIMDQVDARRADFQCADLRGASLRNAKLFFCSFGNALLQEADLTGADLSKSNLSGLCLREAVLVDTDFSWAVLSKCDLEYVEMPGARFRGANLTGAVLTGSIMPRADFRNAVLCRAGLADVDWEQADLRGADLRGCSFHMGSSRSGLVGSPYPGHGSRTGFYTNDYDDQTYKAPEEIRKANLCGADLRGADISGVDFYLVDLRGAKYDSHQAAHFRNCDAILADSR